MSEASDQYAYAFQAIPHADTYTMAFYGEITGRIAGKVVELCTHRGEEALKNVRLLQGDIEMKKEDFERALRQKLKKVPLETRRKWNSTDLFGWWGQAKIEDSYLTWERCPGDVWQWVPGMCKDLFGKDSVS